MDSSSNTLDNKTILITGATSGIGFESVMFMLNCGYKVITPCRDKTTSEFLYNELNKNHYINNNIQKLYTPIIDLSDLKQIRLGCKSILEENRTIDTIVLNAGLQYTGCKEPKYSKQGYELTFAVNHLSHHYLMSFLLPNLIKSHKPRVVITASEVHNPNSPGGRIGKAASLGSLKGIKKENKFSMIDGSSIFNADKAYKDSKLCNILFAKELSRRLSVRGIHMPVIAWAPGLVIPRGNKGFFRYSRLNNELGQRLFALFARDIFRITETPENAGKKLYNLSTSPKYDSSGFYYFSNKVKGFGKLEFSEENISDEASNSNLSKELWTHTCRILNISEEL
tara:strand:+ start:136 stop:1152 length:1017 start_codon:yes stop_codon:yes gene_type:complete